MSTERVCAGICQRELRAISGPLFSVQVSMASVSIACTGKWPRLRVPYLVIEDTEGNVFGALTSCSLHVSDHFYGTGESLLFRFTPRFQAFNWTGDNVYFIKGNNESLAIGAGDGKFGLWLDGDLYQGRTQSCSTYGNEPLAPHEDFVVKTLECFAFI